MIQKLELETSIEKFDEISEIIYSIFEYPEIDRCQELYFNKGKQFIDYGDFSEWSAPKYLYVCTIKDSEFKTDHELGLLDGNLDNLIEEKKKNFKDLVAPPQSHYNDKIEIGVRMEYRPASKYLDISLCYVYLDE